MTTDTARARRSAANRARAAQPQPELIGEAIHAAIVAGVQAGAEMTGERCCLLDPVLVHHLVLAELRVPDDERETLRRAASGWRPPLWIGFTEAQQEALRRFSAGELEFEEALRLGSDAEARQ